MTHIETVPLKLVIVGDGACGKSALLLAYTKKDYNADYIPTVVDNFEIVMGLGDNRQLKLTVMDTAGQEDFKHIRTIAAKGADVCILCYSCDNLNSLDNAKSTWVPEIKSIDATLHFVLVGNKVDKFNSKDPEHVSAKEGRAMGKKVGAFCALQCSALTYVQTAGKQGKVDKIFRAAIKCGLVRNGEVTTPKCCLIL